MLLKSPLRILCAFLLALALPHTAALAQDDDTVSYTVKQGDNLYTLAQRYMRSHRSVLVVQRLNKIANPRRLPIGKTLRIPRDVLRYTPLQLNVAYFSGTVTVSNKTLSGGTKLTEGDTVSTAGNGFVTFASDSGKRFTMPSNSVMFLGTARRYVLNNIEDIDFEVRRGRANTKSSPLKANDRLKVRTPVATTAVRGTEYRTAFYAPSGTSITEVVEGSVSVAVGDEADVASEGFGLASTAEGLGEQEALLPAVKFDAGTRPQTAEMLNFKIVPQDGAVQYRVELARDADFLDIVDESVVAVPSASFNSLDDGRYFVRARGVSPSGVEGINAYADSFLRKRLGVEGSAEPSPLSDGFLFKWLAAGEGTSTYAFQLWREGDAETLLIDETGLTKTSILLTNLEPATYKWRVAVMQSDPVEGLLKVWGETKGLVVSE